MAEQVLIEAIRHNSELARQNAELAAYLSRPEPYQYVLGNTLLDQRALELPGVSFVSNSAGLEINGSVWTLRLEFLMYLMVLRWDCCGC